MELQLEKANLKATTPNTGVDFNEVSWNQCEMSKHSRTHMRERERERERGKHTYTSMTHAPINHFTKHIPNQVSMYYGYCIISCSDYFVFAKKDEVSFEVFTPVAKQNLGLAIVGKTQSFSVSDFTQLHSPSPNFTPLHLTPLPFTVALTPLWVDSIPVYCSRQQLLVLEGQGREPLLVL